MTARPEALAWSVENCTVRRTLDVVGGRWALVVLREVFNGIRRFDDLRIRTAIPRQVLTDTLAHLVTEDVLRREPYREPGRRERHEYRLTAKGFELYTCLVALNDWGARHYSDADGPPQRFVHRDCGAEVHATLTCTDGHPVPNPRDVVPTPGPGARPRTPTPPSPPPPSRLR